MPTYVTPSPGDSGESYTHKLGNFAASVAADISALQAIIVGGAANIAAPGYISGMGVVKSPTSATSLKVGAGYVDIAGQVYQLPADITIPDVALPYSTMAWRVVAVNAPAGGPTTPLTAANFSTCYTTLEGTLDGTKRITWNGSYWTISDSATPRRVIGLYASANSAVLGCSISGGWLWSSPSEWPSWTILSTTTPPTANTEVPTGLPSMPERMFGLYRVEVGNPGPGVAFTGYNWISGTPRSRSTGATAVRVAGLAIGESDSGTGLISVSNATTSGTPDYLDIRLLAVKLPRAFGG